MRRLDQLKVECLTEAICEDCVLVRDIEMEIVQDAKRLGVNRFRDKRPMIAQHGCIFSIVSRLWSFGALLPNLEL